MAVPGLRRFHGTSAHYSEAAEPLQRQALLRWADGARQAGLAVAASLDLDAMPELAGATALCDVVGVGCDFKYRRIGKPGPLGYRDAVCPAELDACRPQAYRQVIRRQYLETVRARQPLLHVVFAETERGVFSYSRLTVPLAVRTGEVGRLWLIPAGFGLFAERLREESAQAA